MDAFPAAQIAAATTHDIARVATLPDSVLLEMYCARRVFARDLIAAIEAEVSRRGLSID